MQKTLEQAITWIMSSKTNIEAFRGNLDAVKKQFPALSEADMQVLKAVQEKGLNAKELEDMEFGEVEAQRSYGWSGPTSFKK